jgi:hypothetical protein
LELSSVHFVAAALASNDAAEPAAEGAGEGSFAEEPEDEACMASNIVAVSSLWRQYYVKLRVKIDEANWCISETSRLNPLM